MYTACVNSCPIATANLVAVQKALQERYPGAVRFLSITLNPELDTPEILADYAAAQGIGADWLFLTGDRSDIEQLRRSLGVYDIDRVVDNDPAQHTGLAIIGNEPYGRWKAMPASTNPIRVRQAIERVILPVTEWKTGQPAIDEVGYHESSSSQSRARAVSKEEIAGYLATLAERAAK